MRHANVGSDWVYRSCTSDSIRGKGEGRASYEARRSDHVSEVDVRTEGNIVHVSFEGAKVEQEKANNTEMM